MNIPLLAVSTVLLLVGSLGILALLAAAVPRAVGFFLSRMQPQTPLNTTPLRVENRELDSATLAAVSFVIHAEADRLKGPSLKVTLPLNPSPWALSGQMRVIPGRITNS
jgi:hypothetical protein